MEVNMKGNLKNNKRKKSIIRRIFEFFFKKEEHNEKQLFVRQVECSRRIVIFYGRCPSSASSTGNKVQHYCEYDKFMTELFGKLKPVKPPPKKEDDKKAEKSKKSEKKKAKKK